jgi:MscS family membrane protein
MNFLDKIYFDNTLGTWLTIAGIIVLALLLKKYVTRYVASLLYKLVRRVWKTVEKKSFVELVLAPLQWFLLTLITVFSLDRLYFPEIIKFNFYHINSQLIVDRLGVTFIILVFTWLMVRLIDFIALVLEEKASTTKDKSDDQLIVFFRDFLKVIMTIIGILLLLKFTFGRDIGNLLTGLSIVGAALALAARESLENIIASFIIFFDKPFITGDTLKVQQITGTVERIGLRSTRIRTADKTLVSVPNKQMVDNILDNWSMRTERRAEIKIELSPKTSATNIRKATAAIKQIIQSKNSLIVSSSVLLKEINKTGLLVTTEYLTNPIPLDEFEELKEEINLQIKEVLEQNNIDMAGVGGAVVINNEVKEAINNPERPIM